MTSGDFIVAVELHSGLLPDESVLKELKEKREAAFLFTPPLTVSLEGLRCKDAIDIGLQF